MADRPDYLFGPLNRSRARPAASSDSARLDASRPRRGTFKTTLPTSAPASLPPYGRGITHLYDEPAA
jgi:hypothetical protein